MIYYRFMNGISVLTSVAGPLKKWRYWSVLNMSERMAASLRSLLLFLDMQLTIGSLAKRSRTLLSIS